jgi:predicted lipid-binding transport protein (Tim44 family)
MGPLAGLAAGIGLAALFSHFGMGEGLANVMMMLLLAGAAVFLVMFLLRRFGGGAAKAGPAYATAAAGAQSPPSAWQQPAPVQRSSFEPVEPSRPAAAALHPEASASGAAAPAAITRAFVPAGFDAEGFTRTAKLIFIRLQAANDTADLDDLRRFTTPELFASIRLEIQERGAAPQQTDVLKVDAEVLDVADEAERQVVSVRFHGRVVEEKGAAPVDFDEVWHLVRPLDESRSWAIAGIEQMA